MQLVTRQSCDDECLECAALNTKKIPNSHGIGTKLTHGTGPHNQPSVFWDFFTRDGQG